MTRSGIWSAVLRLSKDLANCVLALKFVRISTLLVKISITISRYAFGSISSRCSENEPALLPSGIGEDRDSIQKMKQTCESFTHVKINVNKSNRLSTKNSFILTWSSLLSCLGLEQKVAARISQLYVWTLLLTYVKRE